MALCECLMQPSLSCVPMMSLLSLPPTRVIRLFLKAQHDAKMGLSIAKIFNFPGHVLVTEVATIP